MCFTLCKVVILFCYSDDSCWCLECEATPQATCKDSNHKILDQMEDVEEIQGLKNEGGCDHFEQSHWEKAANREAFSNCHCWQWKVFAEQETSKDRSRLVIKKLEETLQQAKEEVKKAQKLRNDISIKVFQISRLLRILNMVIYCGQFHSISYFTLFFSILWVLNFKSINI